MTHSTFERSSRTRGRVAHLVRASDLAQLGFCERYVALDGKRARQDDDDLIDRKRSGSREHALFYQESTEIKSRQAKPQPRPCYFASAVLKDHPHELAQVRRVRDEYLARSTAGRRVISAYWWLSPVLLRRGGVTTAWVARMVAYGVCFVMVQERGEPRR